MDEILRLQNAWNNLDNASGSLYNAIHDLSKADLPNEVRGLVEDLDVSEIDSLKNRIEELLNKAKLVADTK